jgi:DNA primase
MIMASRIPQTFINDLLNRIDIIDVIDGYVPLRKAGRNHQARCPFHDEKTPSFTVSQEKQFYHCFGCGANGTAISFLMDYAGMEFVEAVEELASRAGMEVPREGSTSPRENESTELYELMEIILRHYGKQLREHPEAQRAVEYLKGRGISGQLAADYELGFAPSGWDSLINALGGSADALIRLARTGMIIKRDNGGYYDRFRNRIIFPIRDQRGRAIGVGGRVLGDETPKYLNSPETAIFHKGRELYGLYQARRKLKDIEKIFVVEGYMDVLALAQFGIQNTAATLGTAVTPDHLDRLFKVSPQLVFCFDGDAAGQKAAWRALEIVLPLLRDGRQVYFMFMPEGDDPDTYIRQHGPETFTDTTNHVPLSDYLLNSLKQNTDLNSREGLAMLAERALPYMAKLPAGALRELLLKDLAIQCKLPVDTLRQFIQDKQPVARKRDASRINRVQPEQSLTSDVSKAIRLLLHEPAIGHDQDILDQLTGVDDKGVDFLCELLNYIRLHPDTTCASILEHWRGTRFEQRLRELAAMEDPLLTDEIIYEEKDINRQFMDYISKIKQAFTRKKREILSKNINSLDDFRRLYGSEQDGQKD